MILAVVMMVTTVVGGAATVFAEENLYLKQESSGKCTLASAAMMMRSKAKLEGNNTWANITQQSIKEKAWIDGQGLRHAFTYYGIVVAYSNLKSSNKKAALLALLEKHPEGVEIYVRALPHAVFLTRYNASTDTFYCADPGLSDREMTLEESWLRKVYKEPSHESKDNSNVNESTVEGNDSEGGGTSDVEVPILADSVQQQIIDSVDAYWYISSYKKMEIPEYIEPVDKPDEKDPSATVPEDDDPETEIPPMVTNPSIGDKVSFPRVKSYKNGIFSDISSIEWYVTSVKGAYEMNLMNGMTDTTFEPNGNMSIGQAITLAARIYSIYNGDNPDFSAKNNEMWYMPYVRYAYKNGVISSKYYNLGYADFEKDVLRVQFAEIFSGALPASALPQINEVADGDIPDITITDPGGVSVYKLYRAGILTGDTDGFKPYSKITRCQVATIATRMADSTLRVEII